MPDILTAHTPDPLYPVTGPQVHRWWAVWQAVGHDGYRAGLPAGTYRLAVYGKNYAGGATTWPWPTTDYVVEGPAFEVVPTEIAAEPAPGGLWLWFDAPADGFRMIDVNGSSRGRNPVRGQVQFTLTPAVGEPTVQGATPVEIVGGRARFELELEGASEVVFEDAAGNGGALQLGG
jgi:hypothetical protein